MTRLARTCFLAMIPMTAWLLPLSAADEMGGQNATVRVLSEPFSGDQRSLTAAAANDVAPDQLPLNVSGFPVLETKTAVVACTAQAGHLAFWTRKQDQCVRQGEILLNSVPTTSQTGIVTDDRYGMALEITSSDDGSRQLVALSADGILEIRQPADGTVTVRCPMRYALVPSLVGTDLLFDPVNFPPDGVSYLPSLNIVVGLQEGAGGMLVGVWPPGKQTVKAEAGKASGRQRIESLQLTTAGQPVYLSFIEHPGIWHAQPLRKEYLEKDTPIAWQRPFEARWVGRFFIDSDGYDFPFYFLAERHKLWGRYIRGWFYYPVWFDGQKTMVHFEKKFPPFGDLLIYYLDTYDDSHTASPVGIMQQSLGKDVAAKLLDFEGTKELTLLEHRNAVCAMTYKIEACFAGEPDARPWPEVRPYADDIATFILLIRQRVFQFDKFAADLADLLLAEQKKQPELADALTPCEDILVEIRGIAADDLPDVSLATVRGWTDAVKQLTPDAEKNNLAIVKALTQKCRSVAGTQDDMARNLSVVTIGLMEEAARMGTTSPKHVHLAEQIIARCRAILRAPTWWEPCRRYLPKSNPGAP